MTASSREYFDDVATDWDRMRAGFFPPSIRDRALDKAGVNAGELAADVGAGTGFMAEALLRRGLKVIAVDQSESMLSVLAKNLSGTGAVECRIGDAEHLPIGNDTVDHVFANMVLHHVEDPAVALGEMARVVRPGGTLVVTDLDTHHHDFLRTEHQDRWMGFERDQMRRWLEDAGLRDVHVECAEADCCTTSAGGEGAEISIFLASGRRPADLLPVV